jgi:hypothetical protein
MDEVMKENEEIDEATKGKIFQDSHDSIIGGHHGMNKTCEAIKHHY